MARAFVIRPFDTKPDAKGRLINFEQVHASLIKPALEEAGLAGSTTGEIVDAGNIREDMFSLILEADLVVADISVHNANVFYELGIRHALRRRHTVLIRESESADRSPFDLLTDRYLSYTLGTAEQTEESKRQLVEMIKATLQASRETDSPVFKMLPTLPEVDFSSVRVLPVDFQEEVQRARAAESKGWLRLLAEDVRGRRFQWAGLELIGNAQWDLADYSGARDTWEAILGLHPENLTANLALANVYERLADKTQDPVAVATLLTASEQAIDRVLDSAAASSRQRVEACALQGRNHKTRWRMGFEKLPTLEERRSAAMNHLLRRSFEGYRAAFREDLNHFWSGLAALQMGTIILDLTKADDGWKSSFDDDAQAEAYRRTIEQDVALLRQVVASSVDGELLRLAPNHPARVWAEVSKADVLFLTEDGRQRVVKRYLDVLRDQKAFVHDSAKRQLRLFSELGVRAAFAEEVLQKLTAAPAKPGEAPPGPVLKPLHVMLFAGHRVDSSERGTPRFPAGHAESAKAAITDALGKVGPDHQVLGLASGASGGDILFHEACAKLGIRSVICLPFRADLYAGDEFATLDDWRSRFLALVAGREVRELSDRAALPRWLHGTTVNAWERGNRWVLQMGLASGAPKVSLMALWDGQPSGGHRGGTADMVRAARAAGTIDITILDTTTLGLAAVP